MASALHGIWASQSKSSYKGLGIRDQGLDGGGPRAYRLSDEGLSRGYRSLPLGSLSHAGLNWLRKLLSKQAHLRIRGVEKWLLVALSLCCTALWI